MKYKLGDICNGIADGSHNPPTGGNRSDFVMLSSKNVFDDQITYDDPRYLSEEQFLLEDKRTKIKTGDVLITIVGTVGRSAVVGEDEKNITLQRSVAVLHPNNEICNSRYLMYSLRSMRSLLENESHGIAQKGIYLKQLSSMEINLPMINEQESVVKCLDAIWNIIKQRKRVLQKYDELIKARFVELFGSFLNAEYEKELCEICKFIDYRGKTPEKSNTGIPLITAKNVKNNKFCIEPREFIPEDNYSAIMSRGYPQINDVLFTTEAPLGNVCRIPNIYKKFCVGQRIITMQPHKNILTPEYLEYALLTPQFQNKIWQKSSGSTVKGIRSALLLHLAIPVPPLTVQKSFSVFIQKIDKSKVVNIFCVA